MILGRFSPFKTNGNIWDNVLGLISQHIFNSLLNGEIFVGRFALILLLLLSIITIDKKETRVLSPMEALDNVQEVYACNFEKSSLQDNQEDYYYKLDFADYYLVYEDTDLTTGNYLFRLYEFVIDEVDTGIGHTVTYGYYWVNPHTGEIWEYP